jgi:membrane protease YdiL (CAAX protease family)
LKRSDAVRLPAALFALLLLSLSLLLFPLGSFGSSVFYVSLAFFACALFAASWRKGAGRGLEWLGLAFRLSDAPVLALQSVALAAACVAAALAVSGIFYLAGALDTQAVYEKMVMLPLPALIAAFTIAPLGEEALFRGFIFRKAGEWLSGRRRDRWFVWAAAAAFSSLMFALLHAPYGSLAEIAVAFCIGMVLCAGTKEFGSLWPAVAAHAAFNFASIVMAVLL